MRNRILGVLLAASLLHGGLMAPAALALDLSVRNNTYIYTPVADLDGTAPGAMHRLSLSEAPPTGEMAVDEIRALQTVSPGRTTTVSQSRQTIQPVAVAPRLEAPLPPTPPALAIAVFPVMVHSARDKAFADVPVLLSSAIANQLTVKLKQKGLNQAVLNPIYTYDDLKEQGLDGLYQRMIRDYLEAGQPREQDLVYLAEKLSNRNQQVFWVGFVQAEFDTNHVTKPVGFERAKEFLTDQKTPQPNYFIKGNLQVFSVQPGVPRVINQDAMAKVPLNQFGNFTRSVFDDSDTAMNMKAAANRMAVTLTAGLPQQETVAVTSSVQGALVKGANAGPGITADDQAALKRLLDKQ